MGQYFLFIKNVKNYSRNTMTVAICELKFFFEHTLRQDWTTFNLVRTALKGLNLLCSISGTKANTPLKKGTSSSQEEKRSTKSHEISLNKEFF